MIETKQVAGARGTRQGLGGNKTLATVRGVGRSVKEAGQTAT